MGGASATANRVRRNDELVDFKWGSGGDSATVQRRRIDLGAASSARFGAAWSPEGMGRRKQQRWERVGEEHVCGSVSESAKYAVRDAALSGVLKNILRADFCVTTGASNSTSHTQKKVVFSTPRLFRRMLEKLLA
jgi:hypothetical protein